MSLGLQEVGLITVKSNRFERHPHLCLCQQSTMLRSADEQNIAGIGTIMRLAHCASDTYTLVVAAAAVVALQRAAAAIALITCLRLAA